MRYWITEHDDEEAVTKLLARIDILERAGQPLARPLLELLASLYQNASRALGHPPDATVTLPAGSDRVVARMLAANVVATFWRDEEFKPTEFLPPIVTLGPPWAVPPDAIHVLDLPTPRIRAALSQLRAGKTKNPLTRALSSTSWTPPELFQIQVASALATSRELGPAAVLDRWFLLTLFLCLTHAQYNPSKEGARFAARDANRLLDSLRPDLSRRMARVPDQLSATASRFDDLHKKALEVHEAFRAFGATPHVLSLARDRFDGRIDTRDLIRWKDMSPREIALEHMRAQTSRGTKALSTKTLKDQLRLGDRAKRIEDSWEIFQAHLATVSEETRNQIAFFPTGPLAPPPAPAT